MAEKRYITEKYVWCTCKKHQEVCVGMKFYKYANIVFVPPFVAILAIMSIANVVKTWQTSALALGLLSVVLLVAWSYYADAKKDMLKESHSEECSKKIAKLAVLYAGLWSNFRIMNKESK